MRLNILFLFLCASLGLFASSYREIVIEDFENPNIELFSYPDEDADPDDWAIDSLNTFNDSDYSLILYGNTWKVQPIDSLEICEGDMWQIAFYVDEDSEIQGFALQDSAHTLFYSFDGSQMLDIDEWVTVYQGAFSENQWNQIMLPVAHDWMARFEYYPTITSIVYINDSDSGWDGITYFDHIVNITEDLPVAPEVSISYVINDQSTRDMTVQFSCEIDDPDSDEFQYYWSFGDGDVSEEENPVHTYFVQDDHDYTILLQVCDDTGTWGDATCTIWMDEGESTLPVTVNFVGDIMMARRYDAPGGIIPTQGVASLYEPTLPILGDAADLTVANLECQLTSSYNQHPTKTVCFKGNPNNVEGLSFGGIDIVSLANNHILDYMEEGLIETREMLVEQNIKFSGAGLDEYEANLPVYANISGINMAFLMSSDRTGQYNNFQPYLNAGANKAGFAYLTPYNIMQQIASVEGTADLVTLLLHAGSEYSTEPGDNYDIPEQPDIDYNGDEDYSPLYDVPQMWDRELRHFAVDSGADLVIIHHPHIIQGLEVYNGTLIAHSLGNFIFELDYPETMPSMVLNAEVDEDGYKNFSITPVFIDDYIPQRAEGEMGLHILDYLAQKSWELDTWLDIDRENVIAHVIMDTSQYTAETELYSETLEMVESDEYYTSGPVRLTRSGNISSIQISDIVTGCQFRVGRERLWWGNMEDEGCSLWNLNSSYEAYDNDVFYRGERSLRQQDWSGNDGVTVNLENRIPCTSDTLTYTINGWIKTENAVEATLKVRCYNSRTQNYVLSEQALGDYISGTSDWNYYWSEIDPPEGATFFDVHVYSEFNDSPTGHNWFDDVSLIEWNDWQDIDGMIDIPTPNDYYFIEIRTTEQVGMLNIAYEELTYDENPHSGGAATSAPVFAKLHGNYPNPFNPVTKIDFSLKQSAEIELDVYNIRGQLVRTVVDEHFTAGRHQVVWDGTNQNRKQVATGIYFYRLKANGKAIGTRKMLLLK